ncbi:unnamed protein product [Fraxinus pennsylvanica]|uniref:Uncharacterized protein n=1 Tax=Fraxinus pennsylvanica TaxID=56036 RepID=A0AAD1ZLU5_9LAMI|nr:unnamed protein product [Fraxinus pennsylvanica]
MTVTICKANESVLVLLVSTVGVSWVNVTYAEDVGMENEILKLAVYTLVNWVTVLVLLHPSSIKNAGLKNGSIFDADLRVFSRASVWVFISAASRPIPAEVELVSFDTCHGMVKKYQHLDDFHWAVRPLSIALGLFSSMKFDLFIGRKIGRSKNRKGLNHDVQNGQNADGSTAGNTVWRPPKVGNIFFYLQVTLLVYAFGVSRVNVRYAEDVGMEND